MKQKVKIELYRDNQDLWRWRMKRSGRIIAESGEGYSRQRGAIQTLLNLIASLKTASYQFV